MATERLSDKRIKALQPPESGYDITWDTDVTGLGVRITAPNKRRGESVVSFVLSYRNADGRKRLHTIGRYGSAWSLKAARERAKELKRQIDSGDDPMEERLKRRRAPTVKHLCNYYIETHLPTKRSSSQANDLYQINRWILPRWGSRKVASITQADVLEVRRKMQHRPVSFNRHRALLSCMFNLAINMQPEPWIERNPVKGVPRYPEDARQVYLSTVQIERLLHVLDEYSNPVIADAIRLILLTGARKGEVLSATWSQFDLERAIWTRPSSHLKQKKQHSLPLGPQAVALLRRQQEHGLDDKLVFPNEETGERFYDLKDAWRRIRQRAELPGVNLHDLRHTNASLLIAAGVPLHQVGKMLGHASARTTERYAHVADDPQRAAAAAVGAAIEKVANGKGKVVPLKGKRNAG